MAKVSNLQLKTGGNLMDLALNELNKRADKMEKKFWKGAFKFQFEHVDLWDNTKPMNYTIDVKFENRGFGKSSGYVKQKYRNHFIVFVNTCISDKESMMNTYVHEITHISQKFNGFLDFSDSEEEDRYQRDVLDKKRKSKVSLKKYYHNRHHQNLAEHEAQLASVLQLLKDDKIDSAAKFMTNSPDYFHFEWRSFIQKAYSFGVPKENITKIKEAIIETFEKDIIECERSNSHFTWNNVFHSFIKRNALMNMFGIRKKCWSALYENGNNLSKPVLETNLTYVKKQLELV